MTTLLARRRPPSEPGEMHRIVLPRGLPGIGIVRSAFGRREIVPAQCRARHAPVSGLYGVLSSRGFGVEETPGHRANIVEELDSGSGHHADLTPDPPIRRLPGPENSPAGWHDPCLLPP